MDLDELRAFIAVADTGSFSAAAKSLNFARATLRRRVDELESRSGVQLLMRAADGASVTRAGEILAEKGRGLLSETKTLFDAVRALEHQNDLLIIELPIGLPPSLELMAHKTFRKAAPALRWRIRYTAERFDADTDATFVLHAEPKEELERADSASRWHHTPIGRIKASLVASPEYIEKFGKLESLDELSNHTLLRWERPECDPTRLPLKQPSDEHPDGYPCDASLISPNAHLVRYFAQESQGIAYCPSSKIASFIEEDELIELLPDIVGESLDGWLSVRKDNDAGAIGVLAGAMARFTKAALGTFD